MKVKIDGLRTTLSALNRLEKKAEKKLSSEIEKSAIRMSNNAKAKLTPFGNETGKVVTDISDVRGSIGYSVSGYEAMIYAGGTSTDNMAAYLEFGTCKFAQL